MSGPWWREMADLPLVTAAENAARVGDVVALPGGGQQMIVVEVAPGAAVIAAWRHRSGQMFESGFPADKLRLLRRGR